MTIQLSLHMQWNQSMVPICQWRQKHNWGFMFWSEFVKLVKSKSFNALFFPVLLHVTNSSLNALVHFEILREFLQQQYFKIREVNILLKYLLIVANICPTTRGGNGWTEGSTCKFPFNYRGQMYDTCITLGENAPWCYTVNKPTRTTYGVPWGYCNGDSCPQGNSHFKSNWLENLIHNLNIKATNEILIKKQPKIKFIQIHHMVFKEMKM